MQSGGSGRAAAVRSPCDCAGARPLLSSPRELVAMRRPPSTTFRTARWRAKSRERRRIDRLVGMSRRSEVIGNGRTMRSLGRPKRACGDRLRSRQTRCRERHGERAQTLVAVGAAQRWCPNRCVGGRARAGDRRRPRSAIASSRQLPAIGCRWRQHPQRWIAEQAIVESHHSGDAVRRARDVREDRARRGAQQRCEIGIDSVAENRLVTAAATAARCAQRRTERRSPAACARETKAALFEPVRHGTQRRVQKSRANANHRAYLARTTDPRCRASHAAG